MTGSGLLMGGAPLVVAVLGLIVAELFAGAFEPMIAQRVNTAITSAERATVLSVEGFLYSVTMIWAFPLFAAVRTHHPDLADPRHVHEVLGEPDDGSPATDARVTTPAQVGRRDPGA